MLQTPGVYVEEINPLPKLISPVDMGIPVFIGYTQKAGRRGKSLLRKPIKVESLKQFCTWFGESFQPSFTIEAAEPGDTMAFVLNQKKVSLHYCPNNQLYLYQAVQLFFLNGGASCYILSVGIFGHQNAVIISADDFMGTKRRSNIFRVLEKETEPSCIILPDVIADANIAYPLYQSLLEYCSNGSKHFAILDVAGEVTQPLAQVATAFREGIGNTGLQNAAAYYPWLHTHLVQAEHVDFTALDVSVSLEEILVAAPQTVKDLLQQIGPGISKTKRKNIQLALMAGSAEYATLMHAIQLKRNLVPPAGAVAGAYSQTDLLRGVWKAPASIALNNVQAPAVNISDQEQQQILSDASGGKYINAIRNFPGRGNMIWGARTLAGNNNEWRYVSIRRSMMMMQLSIENAMQLLIFEPNSAPTWAKLRSMVENFLYYLWKRGALQGSKTNEAYNVQIGAGTTMTANDLQEGRLRMQVMVALVKPSEFMVLSFIQMQAV